jgi:DnaK suppressor protein
VTDASRDPDDEVLRREFEPRLRAELADLRESSAGTAADRAPVELDQQSVGRLSRMDALQQQAIAQATEARRRGRGARIEAALRRIDAGDIGYCARCGAFIGLGRLRVDPTTALCLDCAGGA